MIWNWSPNRRTRIGSSTPFSFIDATRSVRSPMSRRGCCGFGSREEISIILPIAWVGGAVSWSTKCSSWRIRRSVGRPRGLDTADDLLAEAIVVERAARVRREGEDRFLVGGTLLEPDALRDHRVEDLLAEDFRDLLPDVPSKDRSLVVERDHDSEDLQFGIGPGFHLLHRLEKVVGAFERKVGALNRNQEMGRRDERVDGEEAER